MKKDACLAQCLACVVLDISEAIHPTPRPSEKTAAELVQLQTTSWILAGTGWDSVEKHARDSFSYVEYDILWIVGIYCKYLYSNVNPGLTPKSCFYRVSIKSSFSSVSPIFFMVHHLVNDQFSENYHYIISWVDWPWLTYFQIIQKYDVLSFHPTISYFLV